MTSMDRLPVFLSLHPTTQIRDGGEKRCRMSKPQEPSSISRRVATVIRPAFGGPAMADDFESGTRSAIGGGNTTLLPFALQPRGASLRTSVLEYHKEAEGKCYTDYGFHLIISDPTPSVLGQELPALVGDGYTSFKVFMTYDDLVLNDRQLLEVFDCARGCGALVMVHCEGYDAIRFMTDRLDRKSVV